MSYGELAVLITAISGGVSGILAWLQARRTSSRTAALENRQTDLSRDQMVWKQYENLVDDLREEVQRLRSSLADEREEIERLTHRLHEMAADRERLLEKVNELERTVDRLQRQLALMSERRAT